MSKSVNRDFKGVWIPKEIWLDKTMSLQEKVFYVEIDSLDNDKGCFAGNEHFSKFFELSKDRCSEIISSLKTKGFITVVVEKNSGKSKRTIRVKRLVGVGENTECPVGENTEYSNTSIISNTSSVDTLTQKTEKFIQELKDTMNGISVRKDQVEEIKKFVSYWTEPDKTWKKQKDPKIRYDHQKTWDMKRRIATWMKNSINFSGVKQTENKYKATMV